MKTKFRLLKKDIRAGQPKDALACPLALCLSRALDRSVSVAEDLIEVTSLGDATVSAKTPKKLRRFIERFDAGKAVKPFKFTLKLK